jgi:hypothetical protein
MHHADCERPARAYPDTDGEDIWRFYGRSTNGRQVMSALTLRTRPLLHLDTWLEVPWQAASKSIDQQLIDCGLKLASLNADADQWSEVLPSLAVMLAAVEACLKIYQAIGSLVPIRGFDVNDTSHLLLPYSNAMSSTLASNDALEFQLVISSIGVRLGACNTADDIFRCIDTSIANNMGDMSVETSNEVRMLRLKAYARKQACEELTRHATNLTTQYLDTHKGSMSAAKLVYTLRQARRHLPTGSEARTRCEAVLDRFGGDLWRLGMLVNPT